MKRLFTSHLDHAHLWAFGLLFAMLLLAALPVMAQDTVTDDDVNAIAKELYCPVCENIPLDACNTPACIQWRGEIRTQLEAGQSRAQIVDDFIRRFGERVVGTPQDPTLRALSLVTPWLLGALVLIASASVLMRWRQRSTTALVTNSGSANGTHSDDEYRTRLEADIRSRR
jgi:cytochrome c-type biogenesis protein CcmH